MLGNTLASGKGVRKLMGDEAIKQRTDGSFDKIGCKEEEEGRGAGS